MVSTAIRVPRFAPKIFSVVAFACIATLLGVASSSASSEPLFTYEPGPPSKVFDEIQVAGAIARYDVSLDPARVAANPPTLALTLPDGRELVATRELFVIDDDAGLRSWVGAVRQATEAETTGDGYLQLMERGDRVTGILNIGIEQYRLISAGPGLHQWVSIGSDTPSCALGRTHADTSARQSPVPHDVAVAPIGAPVEKMITEIDVLAVYTNGFSGAAETGVRDFIEDSVALANTGFIRSQVNARYRLVHMAKLTGAQPPLNTGISAWEWINTAPTEVADLRDAYGADIVGLFVPLSFSAVFCGIANLPQSNGGIQSATIGGVTTTIPGPFGQRAFSVNRDGCGLNDFTFEHEIGHNYGMLHTGSDPLPLFNFASGHIFSVNGTNKASIMQCIRVSGPITGAVCTRVNNFSNPGVILGGSATGTASHDNARVATQQKAAYSAFRPKEVGTCTPGTFALCLLKNRFRVEVDFVDGGVTQKARTKTFSDETGFFWFFGAANLEVGVKMLDGRSFNNRFWAFHGAMTNLQYTVKVTDTIKGTTKNYLRPATSSTVICGGADTTTFLKSLAFLDSNGALAATDTLTFDELDDADEVSEFAGALSFPAEVSGFATRAACVPNSKRLCLLGNRFQVEVTRGGVTQNGFELTDQTGVFTFFSTTNGEVPVKVIDGRSLNGKFWVFFGSMTDQSYSVVVKDTVTNTTKTYTSPAAFCGRADTTAF